MTEPTATDCPDLDLRDPSLYRNRELAWLEFNRRVLHEALDPRTALLERVKFLAIFASNLDEFFQIRVAGVREQVAARVSDVTADRMSPVHQLDAIRDTVRDLVTQHSRGLTEDVIPSLAAHGIHLHTDYHALSASERRHLTEYFEQQVFPVLTPLVVDPAHPFPHISNLSLSLAVSLADRDGEPHFARVKVPRLLPRWVPLQQSHHYLALEQLIGAHLSALFPGVTILGWHPFRITRNTDLTLEGSDGPSDEAEDLLELIQEEVQNRRFGEVVRIEVDAAMPADLRTLLIEEFNEAHLDEGLPLAPADMFELHGPLDATDLMAIAGLDFPALKDPAFSPVTPRRLLESRDIFATLRDEDILLHHPWDAFQTTVERFINAATEDPDVVAIKITLYRTEGRIPHLLLRAAERGKQVAVLIELQARFDEEQNITWARRFEDAGVHVSYGVAGLKTHAKVILVVRREGAAMRRYVHIGTGNYNARTAAHYTDFGLLSADPDLGADLSDLFNVLTGFAMPSGYRKLLVAPTWMKPTLLDWIRFETAEAQQGRPARILAKMNALVDQEIIEALYQASRAGVPIDLIVRGICCLRPGIPGISDTIRVISIVGRFLEHSRGFHFHHGGTPLVLISSADWMPRNLIRRIEAAVPITNPVDRDYVGQVMALMLRDNRQAWDMQSDGRYVQRRPAEGEEERGTQQLLMELARIGTL